MDELMELPPVPFGENLGCLGPLSPSQQPHYTTGLVGFGASIITDAS